MSHTDTFKIWLRDRFRDQVLFDEPMSRHTSFRVGGPAEMFVSPRTLDVACEIIQKAHDCSVPLLAVGDGTNLVVTDKGIPGVVMVLTGVQSEIRSTQDPSDPGFRIVHVQAGVKTASLCRFAFQAGLGGMNFAIGIPGTVGGAIAMNAGTHLGAMENVVHSIRILNGTNQIRNLKREDIRFSYRKIDWMATTGNGTPAVILSAAFRLVEGDSSQLESQAHDLLKKRNLSQPVSLPNAGCIFKNPEGRDPAGKLIDMAGLKGASIGGAQISEKHANFIVNTGDATASDIIRLISLARNQVRERFGIDLETEVKIVGE